MNTEQSFPALSVQPGISQHASSSASMLPDEGSPLAQTVGGGGGG
jgi:hypothetical protein